MRLLLSLLAVGAVVFGLWFVIEAVGLELALVPSLIAALLLTTALHLLLNRPRWRS